MTKFNPVYRCRRCSSEFTGDTVENKKQAEMFKEHFVDCDVLHPDSGCADLIGFNVAIEEDPKSE